MLVSGVWRSCVIPRRKSVCTRRHPIQLIGLDPQARVEQGVLDRRRRVLPEECEQVQVRRGRIGSPLPRGQQDGTQLVASRDVDDDEGAPRPGNEPRSAGGALHRLRGRGPEMDLAEGLARRVGIGSADARPQFSAVMSAQHGQRPGRVAGGTPSAGHHCACDGASVIGDRSRANQRGELRDLSVAILERHHQPALDARQPVLRCAIVGAVMRYAALGEGDHRASLAGE